MSDSEPVTSAEGVVAVLGLVLKQFGKDVRIPEFMVAEGLPSNSKVALFWEGSDLVVGIRPNDWEPEEAE